MKFTFCVQANDGKELAGAIDEVMEQFFPKNEWNRATECVELNMDVSGQVEQKKGKKKTKTSVLIWNVTVEVYPIGLRNSLVEVSKYTS